MIKLSGIAFGASRCHARLTLDPLRNHPPRRSADVDQDKTDTLENLIVSYLAFLSSTDATDLSRDPAGLDLLEQQVIVGRWQGRAQSEIGLQIGKSVSTVHRIEKQAHEKLRKWLLD